MSQVRQDEITRTPPLVNLSSTKELSAETDPLLSGDQCKSTVIVSRKWHFSRHGVRKKMMAVCLWLGYLVVSAAYSLFEPFFPKEAVDKGASPTMVGVIIGSSPLCVVFLAPVFGYLLPRLGLRFTLLTGLWLVGGAYILLGFMSSPQISSGWMFVTFCILLRMTEGVGSAMFFTAAFAVLPELFPNHVGTVMGLFEVACGLGYAVGPVLGGLLYEAGGFSLPFHVVGGVILLLLVPCFLFIKNIDYKASFLSWDIIKLLGTNFIIILLSVANILSIASSSFLTPTFQPFLYKYFKLGPLHVGLIFFSSSLSYVILALIVGPLSDKLGPRGFVVFGVLLYSTSFIFIGPAHFISSPHLWVTVTALVVAGIGEAFGIAPVYADILAVAKRASPNSVDSEALNSVLSGVLSSTTSLGEFIGPIIGGGLTQYFDFQTSTLLFGEVTFAMGLLLVGTSIIDRLVRSNHRTALVNNHTLNNHIHD